MNSFKSLSKPLLLAFIIGLLTACAGPQTISAKHAMATRSNQMAQAVNPSAGQAPAAPIGLDGQKAEQVIKAYRADKGKASSGRLISNVAQ